MSVADYQVNQGQTLAIPRESPSLLAFIKINYKVSYGFHLFLFCFEVSDPSRMLVSFSEKSNFGPLELKIPHLPL